MIDESTIADYAIALAIIILYCCALHAWFRPEPARRISRRAIRRLEEQEREGRHGSNVG